MSRILVILLFLFPLQAAAGDSSLIRVHFIYGSRPVRAFRAVERPWFGGIHGGHIGLQAPGGGIVSFVPHGRFHKVARRRMRHSRFVVQDSLEFYSMFGNPLVRQAIISIPVSSGQLRLFDSVTAAYLRHTPYDYAFLGMRCTAAAADVLGHSQVLRHRGRAITCARYFYPRRLRSELRLASARHGWQVTYRPGRPTRKWEKD